MYLLNKVAPSSVFLVPRCRSFPALRAVQTRGRWVLGQRVHGPNRWQSGDESERPKHKTRLLEPLSIV